MNTLSPEMASHLFNVKLTVYAGIRIMIKSTFIKREEQHLERNSSKDSITQLYEHIFKPSYIIAFYIVSRESATYIVP